MQRSLTPEVTCSHPGPDKNPDRANQNRVKPLVLRVEWNFGYEITYDTTHTAKCEETVVRAAPTTPPIVAI